MARESHLSLIRSVEPSDHDPIFASIERHRRAAAIWSSAVHREFKLEGKNDAQFAEARRVEQKARADKGNAVADLVQIGPTTVAGVVALLRYYARSAALDGGTFWPDYFGDGAEEYSLTLAAMRLTPSSGLRGRPETE
jgi:hypothetical protein